VAEKIECPTLVCDNVADSIAGGQAKELYEALKCPKEYILFTAEEGATGHAEGRGGKCSSIARCSTGWIRPWRRATTEVAARGTLNQKLARVCFGPFERTWLAGNNVSPLRRASTFLDYVEAIGAR
jgi:hypothetical protein